MIFSVREILSLSLSAYNVHLFIIYWIKFKYQTSVWKQMLYPVFSHMLVCVLIIILLQFVSNDDNNNNNSKTGN